MTCAVIWAKVPLNVYRAKTLAPALLELKVV
jgi:hypothetical protein